LILTILSLTIDFLLVLVKFETFASLGVKSCLITALGTDSAISIVLTGLGVLLVVVLPILDFDTLYRIEDAAADDLLTGIYFCDPELWLARSS
jgi:hypothetical protein